jgi:tetratricopeptide (TPR) repeat protein
MHLVRNSLGIELLDQKRWNQIGERYYQAYESLRKVIERLTASSEDSHALKVATSAAEKSLPDEWMYHSRAAVEIERHAPEKADEIFRQGLENFPESTVLIGTYASFLYFERADVNRSESLFKRAIDLDPTNVANLNNYAVLLFHQREDLEGAEHLFRRALDIEPDFGDTLANFAQLLLATGRKEEAKSLIDRKIKRSPPEITGWDTLDIELLVYRYAHQLGSAKRILRKLKAALSNGDRSPRWNFDLNYKRAKDEGHPNLPLLHDIIEVVTNKAGLSVLDSYKEWSSIKPDVRLQG